MKKNSGILLILFCMTAVLLFAPLIQQNLKPFTFKKLSGYLEPAPKPSFSYEAYKTGKYQHLAEGFLKENFGFHDPLIRIYNQCTYDLFKTTSNKDVAIEKDGWLYHTESIRHYFGTMGSISGISNQQVHDNLANQALCLYKTNAILQEYGIHLLTFTLPTKSFVYPEHLRKHPIGDTTFNAATFLEKQLALYGVPHINMTPWFQQMQDTCPISLFYSKDSHWASGAVFAMDSVLRYMERLSGQQLTQLQIGTPYPVYKLTRHEADLEDLLNLARPLKHEPLYEYPIHYLSNKYTQRPTVWFLGTSFYWRITRRINFDALFSSRDFLYYTSIYYTNREQDYQPGYHIDLLHELLTHDFVVLFKDGPQLYHQGALFPGKFLINLCISEERQKEKINFVADSIIQAWDPQTYADSIKCYSQAEFLLQQNPEMFEELRGDSIPTCRNPRIEQILVEKKIRADRTWRFLLTAKANNDSLDVQKTFEKEAYNVLNNKELLRNHTFFTTYDYFDLLVKEALDDNCWHSDLCITKSEQTRNVINAIIEQAIDTVEKRIQQHAYDNDTLMMMACAMDKIVKGFEKEPNLVALREKAVKKQISLDKMFRDDVVWIFNTTNYDRRLHDDVLTQAFANYRTERKMRNQQQAMESIMQKHQDLNMPLRIILNRDIKWIQDHKQQ
ncbi:MAG: hypothetical protein IJ622_01280 [Bacteroidales bacterium]|nr:hypothetical protein [Bacteroidales bacterium]